jgi:hypothetical protein
MVAMDGMSFLVSGLESWKVAGEQPITEYRLAQILGVRHFYLPPAPSGDQINRGDTTGIRVRRFPAMYSCPGCKKIDLYSKFNPRAGTECGACQNRLVPSRFVLACEKGHLEDFPYWKWVHRGPERVSGGGRCGGQLTFRTEGSTASLRSITIGCTCGVPDVSMEGAFRSTSLRELNIKCGGKRPWLRDAADEECTAKRTTTLQRGAASVWSPVVRSAISIPPWGQGVHAIIERDSLNLLESSEDYVRQYIANNPLVLAGTRYTVEDVLVVRQQIRDAAAELAEGEAPVQSYSSLRAEEYRRLCEGNTEDPDDFLQSFVCEAPDGGSCMPGDSGIAQVMLVKRLREVRALHSFTRIAAPADQEDDARLASLTIDPDLKWLPAIEVSGEGVFLRFDPVRLQAWESQPEAQLRAARIRRHHQAELDERAAEIAAAALAEGDAATPEPRRFLSPVNPRLLLLHTFAHAVINEWSLDGGYPAAALRERLYVGSDMSGILIYTATSDSAGSLGGVVAQGDPTRLAASINAALERATWCSNDPLCMESEAGGAGSLNLAACHACSLLPETSCEHFNSLLDRGLLVGTEVIRSYFDH